MNLPVVANRGGNQIAIRGTFGCKKAILDELPIDYLMDLAYYTIRSNDKSDPSDEISLCDFHDVANVWDDFLLRRPFRNWCYRVTLMEYDWEEAFLFQISAERKYSVTELLVVEDYFTEDTVLAYLEQRFGDNFHEFDFRAAMIYLRLVLEEAQTAIRQWNSLCMQMTPIFTAPPPLQEFEFKMLHDIRETIFNDFLPMVIFDGDTYPELANGNAENFTREEILDLYVEREGYFPRELLAYSFEYSRFPFGDYWALECNVYINDGFAYFQILVTRKGLKMKFIVTEWGEDFYYGDKIDIEEIPKYIANVADSIESAMIQWNELLLADNEDLYKDSRRVRSFENVGPPSVKYEEVINIALPYTPHTQLTLF